MRKEIIKHAFLNASLTALYVALVAAFIFYVPRQFAEGKPDTILAPILMLMLFVLSAGMTAILMLGRPILWYLEEKKKEAVHLLLSTFASFFLIIVIAFLIFVATA